jgi:long-chain acyl-CoA synthetase
MLGISSLGDEGDRIFVRARNHEPVTFAEASAQIEVLSKKLNDFDRQTCLLFFANELDSVLLYLALLNAGVVPLPIAPDTNEHVVSRLIEAYHFELIAGPGSSVEAWGTETLMECNSHSVKLISGSAIEEISQQLALLLNTSGSTGDTKAVRLSCRNLESVSASIVEYLQIQRDDTLASSLPFYYSYGLSVLHAAVQSRATLSLGPFSLLNKDYWASLDADEVSVFSAVPAMLANMIGLGIDEILPRSLRALTVAGGKLNNDLTAKYLEIAEAKNFSFFSMYGATEAAPRMSYVPPIQAKDKLGSAGIPIPGGEFRIRPLDDNPALEGEIVYLGPNVALGYAESREELNRGDDFLGQLFTGDLGHLDSDGFLYITGRLKRISKQQGIRLNLDHIENVLAENSVDSMVVDIDDRLTVVTTCSDIDKVKTILKQYLSRSLKIRVINQPSLPFNANGKKDYQYLALTLRDAIR